MREIRVAAGQFEARDGDKNYNLGAIARLTAQAAKQRAELISFHECSISGYTFLQELSRADLAALAEEVPDGPSTRRLVEIARSLGVTVAAGLVERDDERLYNAYVVVSPQGFVAKHRKIHEFISEHLTCGDSYTVVEHLGCRLGILTCYDNNLPENVRATALKGAEVILMPHVTGCLPSPMPGRGTVDPDVWRNRERDPVRCRQEFDGPKGRGWIMRWLPTRAYENGVFALYTNPIGVEGDTIKPGGSMILDPFGEILNECRALGDEVVIAALDPERIKVAPGQAYIRSRRPELYEPLLEPNPHLGADKQPEVWWKKVQPPPGARRHVVKAGIVVMAAIICCSTAVAEQMSKQSARKAKKVWTNDDFRAAPPPPPAEVPSAPESGAENPRQNYFQTTATQIESEIRDVERVMAQMDTLRQRSGYTLSAREVEAEREARKQIGKLVWAREALREECRLAGCNPDWLDVQPSDGPAGVSPARPERIAELQRQMNMYMMMLADLQPRARAAKSGSPEARRLYAEVEQLSEAVRVLGDELHKQRQLAKTQ